MTDDEIFEPQAEPEKNILRVEIRCMTPPSEVQRARLRALLLAEHGADDVEFVIRRDETVGDGFNIFVGDDNYDWSTLGRVRQLRRSMQALPREKQSRHCQWQARPARANPLDSSAALPALPLCGVAPVRPWSTWAACPPYRAAP